MKNLLIYSGQINIDVNISFKYMIFLFKQKKEIYNTKKERKSENRKIDKSNIFNYSY